MVFIDALQWRYATKRMNGNKIPDEKIENILKVTRLAPSSMGLQPYTILLIGNEDLKRKLHPAANSQPQILESSHLMIFAAWKDITEKEVNEYLTNIAQTRQKPLESLDNLRNSLLRVVHERTPEMKFQWAARQAYIAFGITIAAAALEQVDTTPMEGFNADAVDTILGLQEKGLSCVTILALGYRDAEKDYLVKEAKVRRNLEQLILRYE